MGALLDLMRLSPKKMIGVKVEDSFIYRGKYECYEIYLIQKLIKRDEIFYISIWLSSVDSNTDLREISEDEYLRKKTSKATTD